MYEIVVSINPHAYFKVNDFENFTELVETRLYFKSIYIS